MARPGAALMEAKAKAAAKKPIRIKPSERGSLHRALGVPEGERIPESKVEAAAESGSANLRKKAVFAENFGH